MTRTRRSIASWIAGLALVLSAPALAQSRAEQLLWQGKVDAALLSASEVATERPEDMDAQELLIDLLLSTGLPHRAEALYRRRVTQNPTDPDAQYLLGRALVGADDARRSYERALRFDPTHARSHMGMAAIHTAEGRLAEARDAYARAVTLNPELGEAWLGLIRSHAAAGDIDAAARAAADAVAHVPGEGAIYLALATLDPGRASDWLARGVTAVPADPRLHEARARQLLAAGDPAGALTEADRALAIDPTLGDATRAAIFARAMAGGHLDRAAYLRLSGLATDPNARASADALVSAWPNTALTWLARAQLRQAAGDREGAVGDLEAALRVDPADVECLASYGLLLLQVGRSAEARRPLARAVDARPWDASLATALGRAHLGAGDPGAAVLELGAALQRHPWSVDVALVLAQAHVDGGDPQQAYVLLKGMLSKLPDPRLAAALVMAAPAAGRHAEAAALLDQLASQSGSAKLRELAARLRQGG